MYATVLTAWMSLYTLLLLLLLQLGFHSVAVVLTLVQKKQIIYIKETIQKHSTNNTKHSKYKYTYYKNTQTLQNQHIHTSTHIHIHTLQNPHITKSTHTQTHTLQNQLKQPQHKMQITRISHSTINYPQSKITEIPRTSMLTLHR